MTSAASPTSHRAPTPEREEAALLDVRGLTVEYLTAKGPVRAVDGVSFAIRPGEVFGVEGHESQSRRALHPPDFVALEQTFPDYPRCLAWEAENLDRLLRYRGRR